MTLEIPELDQELQKLLQEIVTKKYYAIETTEDKEKWLKILPKLNERLETIANVSRDHGEQFGKRPEGVDLIKRIQSIKDRVLQHLNYNFPKYPPFTIYRLSEILVNSSREGYDLIDNVHILKYFNSLAKLIFVSTDVSEFPITTFSLGSTVSNDELQVVEPIITSQSSINIPLVEIPWLKEKEEKEEKSIPSSDISIDEEHESHVNDDMIISPPPPVEEEKVNNITKTVNMNITEITPSPVRRRRGEEEEEELLSSSPVTNSDENVTKRFKPENSKPDEDNMDISSSPVIPSAQSESHDEH
ncbi:uncharacterized protein RJT21DRAFT_28473 [Scheffersomyces amazonensis]|uniref:uncharacterized protein n=1 Tax=Scheffersomyces amazonensis TaxID=1078765 RepID=UPI00315C5DE3